MQQWLRLSQVEQELRDDLLTLIWKIWNLMSSSIWQFKKNFALSPGCRFYLFECLTFSVAFSCCFSLHRAGGIVTFIGV